MATWLITGCSSGLGRALAEEVLGAGHHAVLTARDPTSLARLIDAYPDSALAVALDVRDHQQVLAAVEQGVDRFGGIDVLVNNAGHGYRSAVEEGSVEEVQELFETNFFGAVDLIKAVLPHMRQRRRGAVVNVSSIAGRFSNPGSGYYSASKYALEGLSHALKMEVAPLGIKVVVIEPGAFRTEFAGRSLQQSTTAIDDYAGTAGLRRKENDHSHGTQPGDPARAARAIVAVLDEDEPPLRLLLGTDAVQVIGAEIEAQQAEARRWDELSRSTDFLA